MTLRRILLKKSHGGDRKSSGHFDHLKTEQGVAEQFGVSPRKEKAPAKMTRAGQNNK
jgi:hypothetical protein